MFFDIEENQSSDVNIVDKITIDDFVHRMVDQKTGVVIQCFPSQILYKLSIIE
jgi:hypothetical protein